MPSGKCGENLTWTLDDGTLTISGRGAMENYFLANPAPWYHCRASITKVVIKDGVTTIGRWAFGTCKNLTSVIISDFVTSIGRCTFSNCKRLTGIKIPDAVTTIGDWTFSGCTGLEEIHYPSGRGFEKVLSQGNNAKLIPYDELPPELKAENPINSITRKKTSSRPRKSSRPPKQIAPSTKTQRLAAQKISRRPMQKN